MSQLVEFLCKGDHPIEATLREKTREAMKEAIARGHVPIKFTDTRGGTELVVVDRVPADLPVVAGIVTGVGRATINESSQVATIASVDAGAGGSPRAGTSAWSSGPISGPSCGTASIRGAGSAPPTAPAR